MINSRPKRVKASFTRPNDEVPYFPNDVISQSTASGVLNEIVLAGPLEPPSGMLVRAWLIDSVNTNTTTLNLECWIFNSTYAGDADNATFTPTDPELTALAAIIPFVASYVGTNLGGTAGNRVYVSDILNTPYNARTAYWSLVSRLTATPAALEVFTLMIDTLQD